MTTGVAEKRHDCRQPRLCVSPAGECIFNLPMDASMTTKYRIIIGFAFMVLLLVSMAFFGHRNIEMSSANFEAYQKIAQLNAICSESSSALNAITSDIFRFQRDTRNKNAIKVAHDSVSALISQIKRSDGLVESAERTGFLKKMLAAAQKLDEQIDVVTNSLTLARDLFDKDVQPAMSTMVEDMRGLGQRLHDAGTVEALAGLARVWPHLASAQASLERFADSRDMEEGKKARGYLEAMKESMEKTAPYIFTQEGRDLYARLVKSRDSINASLAKLEKQLEQGNTGMSSLLAEIAKVREALVALNDSVTAELTTLGPQILNENRSAQQYMLVTSLAGIFFGAVLAAGVVVGFIRLLTDLSGYASAMARGDFSHQLRTREKGEIGRMVEAMKMIPLVLNRILEEYKWLERKIEGGYLNSEGDAEKFEGEFAVLVHGTNNILDRFRMVLENIPSPVIVLNKDLKAAYINIIARKLVGDDWHGMTCYEMFHRDDYGSDRCGLTTSVNTKAPASGETKAHPQGKTMDVAYTAIPMLDEQGNITSVMQLLTDLTEIKTQQRTMLEVANHASNIADRLAAASEELSTQVGEISRGAEIQRTRVESTASAMAEMNSTVLEVARNAAQAADQSQNSRHKAEDGSGLVNRVVQSINAVNNVAHNLQGNMSELGNQAENIGSIMGVISDIADQTNLLALNAAIEAARAGDAGRGFAVVADEVRKLAEKTMSATLEVSTAITAIQASARTNIDEVHSAVESVTEATGLANASGAALDEIVTLASDNSTVVSSIAAAAEEQSAASEEISRAIEEINRIVGETSEGIVQSSVALQDLSQMAQELRTTMEELR